MLNKNNLDLQYFFSLVNVASRSHYTRIRSITNVLKPKYRWTKTELNYFKKLSYYLVNQNKSMQMAHPRS